ncbi:MAG: DUF2064 domain-containing protein [Actinomycetota bacterium]
MSLSQTTLIVLAKEPIPGRSKTRLSPPFTLEEAAALAQAMLHDTLRAVTRSGAGRKLLVLDGRPGAWVPPGLDVIPQRGETHAGRIAAAFADAGGSSLLIGMDTPQVTAPMLDRAAEVLWQNGVDAILGPASDGGWWLAGLRMANPEAFEGVPMSLPTTADRQKARFAELGLRTRQIETLTDVDDWPSALRIARQAPATSFAKEIARLMSPAGLS